MANKKKTDPHKTQEQGREKQDKPTKEKGISALAMRERLERKALECGFTLMTEERYREIIGSTVTVQFIPQSKDKKNKS